MHKHVYRRILLACLLSLSTQLSAKTVQYVSDQLTIPMRSGPSNSHKILKFLTSGTAVNVIETSDDKAYSQINLPEDESKTGWVETSLLMPQPSAREQLVSAAKTSQSLKEKHAELKNELAAVQKHNAELLNTQKQLETKIQDLLNTLAKFRESAADPIRTAEENEALKQQLQQEQDKTAELMQHNAFLADKNIKEWFLIGAGVSIGSLILGLILTRIRWRKRDSWAGSF